MEKDTVTKAYPNRLIKNTYIYIYIQESIQIIRSCTKTQVVIKIRITRYLNVGVEPQ